MVLKKFLKQPHLGVSHLNDFIKIQTTANCVSEKKASKLLCQWHDNYNVELLMVPINICLKLITNKNNKKCITDVI